MIQSFHIKLKKAEFFTFDFGNFAVPGKDYAGNENPTCKETFKKCSLLHYRVTEHFCLYTLGQQLCDFSEKENQIK